MSVQNKNLLLFCVPQTREQAQVLYYWDGQSAALKYAAALDVIFPFGSLGSYYYFHVLSQMSPSSHLG